MMRSKACSHTVLLLSLLNSAIVLLPVNQAHSQSSQSHLLKYKFQKGRSYAYVMAEKSNQVVEMMGTEQKMFANTQTAFTLAEGGHNSSGNLEYTMTITDFELAFTSALMDSTIKNPPEIMGLKLRKEIKEHGDQVRTLVLDDGNDELGGLVAQSFNVSSEFLPNLPYGKLEAGRAVKLSDVDTVSTSGRTVISSKDMEYVLEGEELKMGYNCVRVRYQGLVNAEGSGSFQGMMQFDLQGDGDIEGVLHFAPKEGIIISDERTATMELTAKITGPQNMTLPITQTEKRTLIISR
ncbi:hypothetical protein MJD09_21935 [bacterium]|nr:hypothetical protein [bacterium]